jgi:hypothetical protein
MLITIHCSYLLWSLQLRECLEYHRPAHTRTRASHRREEEHHQPSAIACLSPFRHWGVAFGISKGRVGPLADEHIDADCLPGPSMKNAFGSRIITGLPLQS